MGDGKPLSSDSYTAASFLRRDDVLGSGNSVVVACRDRRAFVAGFLPPDRYVVPVPPDVLEDCCVWDVSVSRREVVGSKDVFAERLARDGFDILKYVVYDIVLSKRSAEDVEGGGGASSFRVAGPDLPVEASALVYEFFVPAEQALVARGELVGKGYHVIMGGEGVARLRAAYLVPADPVFFCQDEACFSGPADGPAFITPRRSAEEVVAVRADYTVESEAREADLRRAVDEYLKREGLVRRYVVAFDLPTEYKGTKYRIRKGDGGWEGQVVFTRDVDRYRRLRAKFFARLHSVAYRTLLGWVIAGSAEREAVERLADVMDELNALGGDERAVELFEVFLPRDFLVRSVRKSLREVMMDLDEVARRIEERKRERRLVKAKLSSLKRQLRHLRAKLALLRAELKLLQD